MIVAKNKCCGCEACASICPKKAITMEYDEEGFRYPVINKYRCIGCDLCKKVCPVISPIGNRTKADCNCSAFSGYIEDEDELLSSASGGAATAISRLIIRDGGVVFGCVYSSDFTYAYYSYTTTIDGLNSFKGSKYFQCEKNDIYFQVSMFLNQGRKVLFIGLPCEVVALINFLGGKKHNLFTIDLICHGPTSMYVNYQYVKKLEKENNSRIKYFSVRDKKEGWAPPYLYAVFENEKYFSQPFYETEYGTAFAEFSRPACYNCRIKGDNRYSDITIGDYWGIDENYDCWNKNGVSILIVHSPNGYELVKKLANFRIFSADLSSAIKYNPCYIKSRLDTRRRKHFSRLFISKGLEYACSNKYTIVNKIKMKILMFYKKIKKCIGREEK